MTITSAQIREARRLLGWSPVRLSRDSGLQRETIYRAEAAEGVPELTIEKLSTIKRTLEKAGIEFIAVDGGGPGVRLRKGAVS